MKVRCGICHHNCSLDEGQLGVCRARRNRGGRIICENYGRITSIALDPIEKKPLYRFRPGSRILSVGSYGCNMRCLNCQNCEISMADPERDARMARWSEMTPEELVERAVKLALYGNVGLAYTYNEPFIGYEFVMDCAKLIRERGLVNVAVTNGCINEQPLLEILPYFDAMNIDLKSFRHDFYRRMGGDLDTVLNTIKIAAKRCHVEVTTLIITRRKRHGRGDGRDSVMALRCGRGHYIACDAVFPRLENEGQAAHARRQGLRFGRGCKTALEACLCWQLLI